MEFRFHSLDETTLLNMDYHIFRKKLKFLEEYDKAREKEAERQKREMKTPSGSSSSGMGRSSTRMRK